MALSKNGKIVLTKWLLRAKLFPGTCVRHLPQTRVSHFTTKMFTTKRKRIIRQCYDDVILRLASSLREHEEGRQDSKETGRERKSQNWWRPRRLAFPSKTASLPRPPRPWIIVAHPMDVEVGIRSHVTRLSRCRSRRRLTSDK